MANSRRREGVLRIDTAWDITLSNLGKTEFLVQNWIPRSSLTIIAGSPESGKSTALRTLAVGLTNGARDWLGWELGYFEDSPHFPEAGCLLVFLEESEDEVKRHLLELGLKSQASLQLLALEAGDDPVLVLDEALGKYRPNLTVIDTLGEFCGVENMNDYGEVIGKLKPLRDLSNKHKTAILLSHHTPKQFSGAENALLGSTGIRGAVDSAAVIRALPRTGLRLMEPSKVRIGTRFESIAVGLTAERASFRLGSADEAQARENCAWFASLIEAEQGPMSRSELQQHTGLPFPEVARSVLLDPDGRLSRVRVGQGSVKYALAMPEIRDQDEPWEGKL